MAVPRLALPGGADGGVSLPHPLDAAAAARIRRIFALQRGGDIPSAIVETTHLADDTLLGDVLADRYLRPGATVEPGQLRLWLKTFSDLPDAPAIYQRLAAIAPRGLRATAAPSAATLGLVSPAPPLPEEADPADHAFTRSPALDHVVQERLATGTRGAQSALHLIAAARSLDPLYASQLRAELALGLFTGGETSLALQTARAAFADSDGRIGLAGFVAGLAAWRGGAAGDALPLFEAASRASLTPVSLRAGAAFWAARAHRGVGDTDGYRAWLQRAAAAPHTFYGLLARHLLDRSGGSGRPLRLVGLDGATAPSRDPATNGDDDGRATLSEIDVDAVAATPAGRRVFALLQVGETARAEAALRRLWPGVQNDMALCRSIQLVADAAGLGTLSEQLAGILRSRSGRTEDEARLPLPRLSPHRGFTVNPALVYALTRLESNFDPSAVSDAGAHGLMQLMPVTAGFVLGAPGRFADDATPLHDAALNLEIGQRYLTYLARQDGVKDDLIRLLASYNAGPGAVGRWEAGGEATDDPLMFIESLPADETRDYVRRAFAYLWIYAARLHLPAPSLDSLANGDWPGFAAEQAVRPHRLH